MLVTLFSPISHIIKLQIRGIFDLNGESTPDGFNFEEEARQAFENFPVLKSSTFLTAFSKTDNSSSIFVAEDQLLKEQLPHVFDEAAQSYRKGLTEMLENYSKKGYGSAASRFYSTAGSAMEGADHAVEASYAPDAASSKLKPAFLKKNKNIERREMIQGVYLDMDSGSVMYPANPQKGLAFTMDHEIGHLVVPGAHSEGAEGNIHFREACADAFAAIRAFQRYGSTAETREMLQSISMARTERLLDPYAGDNGHYTSPTLDKILEDSTKIDFSKVSYNEAIKIARKYATDCIPTQEQYTKASPIFQLETATFNDYYRKRIENDRKAEILEQLATTTLATSDKFSFSMGVRAFQPFMSPELNSLPELTEKLASQLAGKARQMGLTTMADSLEGKKMEAVIPQDAPSASKFLKMEPKKTAFNRLMDELKNFKNEILGIKPKTEIAPAVTEPQVQKKPQQVIRL